MLKEPIEDSFWRTTGLGATLVLNSPGRCRKVRRCLKCNKNFQSVSSANRICSSCLEANMRIAPLACPM